MKRWGTGSLLLIVGSSAWAQTQHNTTIPGYDAAAAQAERALEPSSMRTSARLISRAG